LSPEVEHEVAVEEHEEHEEHDEREEREGGDERMRVLHLVARGAITPHEAAELLAALDPPGPPPGPPSWAGATRPVPPIPPVPPVPPVPPIPPVPPAPPRGPFVSYAPANAAVVGPGSAWPEPRTLIIRATDGEGEVNVRLPLALAMSSNRFLSRRVRERLEQHEIDLDQMLQHAGAYGGRDAPGQVVHVTDGEGELKITLE
jgi:hypothetical protein